MGSVTYFVFAGSGTLLLAVIAFVLWKHSSKKRKREYPPPAAEPASPNRAEQATVGAQEIESVSPRSDSLSVTMAPSAKQPDQAVGEAQTPVADERTPTQSDLLEAIKTEGPGVESPVPERPQLRSASPEASPVGTLIEQAHVETAENLTSAAPLRDEKSEQPAVTPTALPAKEEPQVEMTPSAQPPATEEPQSKEDLPQPPTQVAGGPLPPPESKVEPVLDGTLQPNEESETKPKDEASGDADRVPKEYEFPTPKPGKNRKRDRKKRDSNLRQRPMEILVTAHPDHHGFCTFSILAQRPTDSPADLKVRCGNESVTLIEYNEAWYEAAATDELVSCLSGVVFTDKRKGDSHHSWQLSSRPLHVLAVEQGFGSLVSTTRLCVGRKHLVLCRADFVQEVQRVLAEVGCPAFESHGEDFGAPSGWVFLWPVTPSQPRPPVEGDKILNALRPQPDLDLVLEGGVWLHDSTWLAGYPPQITVSGVRPPDQPVHINRVPALEREDGSYSTPGCDKPGDYAVWCAGKSRGYSIAEPQAMCDRWEPHSYHGGSVCGALVTTGRDASRPPVTVPASNLVLIGAEPGQVFYCPPQVGTEWTGFVPFPVVWALPADPLRCDRSLRKVVLLTLLAPKASGGRVERPRKTDSSCWRWSKAIRDCRRKGLTLSPGDEGAEALWWAYVARAGGRFRRRQKHGA